MKRTRLIAAALVVTASACSASTGEQSTPTDAPDSPETTITPGPDPSDPPDVSPTSESSTTVSATPPPVVQPLYEPGDIDRGLQPFIDQAIDDLSERLDVDASAITARAAVLVVWPDGSLGCPQPGVAYAQVLTDGSVIELEHDGNVYRYHTGGSSGPFICEQPITKAPPTELLTLDDFDS